MNRREFTSLAAVPFVPLAAAAETTAPKTRTILIASISREKLKAALVPKSAYKPYPTASERGPWESLPAKVRAEGIKAGEKHLKAVWPPLPVTLMLDYIRTGNRTSFESPSATRRRMLAELVTAECIEGKGRFLNDIATGIWAICEESYWGSMAHLTAQKGGVDLPNPDDEIVELFSAETAGLLSYTDFLLGAQLDGISKVLRRRMFLEVNRRTLTPALERNWSWMGLTSKNPVNNWDPWICSNWLTAALLLEPDAVRREAAVWKIMTCLDRFFSSYYDDGGCDEGPSYWGRAGASLFECLSQLHGATRGAVDVFQDPLVRNIGAYIYKAHVAGDYYVNFADAPGIVHPPGEVVYRFGKAVGDPMLAAFGGFCEARGTAATDASLQRRLPGMLHAAEMAAAPKEAPLARDVWFPGMQVAAGRSKQGSSAGLYFAAQGGHNAESHNHNDVGNFIVYAGGLPYLIDLGPETYTAKTFSAKRYEIWVMQSAYHNLPTINGVMQSAGRQFQATKVEHEATAASAKFSLNIEEAYPKEAGLKSWRRVLELDRSKNELALQDKWELTGDGKIEWTFMTPCTVSIPVAGELLLERLELGSPKVRLRYDASAVAAAVEKIPITDARLKGSWGTSVSRVLLKMAAAKTSGQLQVRVLQDG